MRISGGFFFIHAGRAGRRSTSCLSRSWEETSFLSLAEHDVSARKFLLAGPRSGCPLAFTKTMTNC